MAKPALDAIRINRNVISVTNLQTAAEDVRYWLSQAPWARWQHMENLRRINYGKAVVAGRLKRVLEIAQPEKS